MDLHLNPGPISSLPGYVDGDCFVTWHARYQRSVAYHEAGHVVAFIVADRAQFGVKVESGFRTLAYVEALGAMGGQVGVNRAFKDYSDVLGLDHPPVEDIDHGDPLAPSLVFAMEQDILSYLAGPYAQVASEQGSQPTLDLRRSACRLEEAESDFAMAAELHREVCRISKRRIRFTELEERACHLVAKCWAAVDLLASKLLVARYLDADEVYPLVTCRLPE